MARPTKLTPGMTKAICEALRAGNTRTAAGAYAGISHQTFTNWFKGNEDFADAVLKAEADAEVRNVAIIQTAAKETWTAAAWWLERRKPENWRQKKDLNVRTLSDADLIRLLEADASAGSDEAGVGAAVEIGDGDPEIEPVLEVSD